MSSSDETTSARAVSRVAVVGAGTMGTGIAISLITAGFDVVLIDAQAAALENGLERVKTSIEAAVAKGRLSASDGLSAIRRVSTSGEFDVASTADLAIEAVIENLSVKRDVFVALDRRCRSGAILASNTSTLDMDAIAAVTKRPDMVVGMHFFSPANIMRLVEVVRARATCTAAIEGALAVVRRMGKIGIVVGNAFGFVGNKMLYAYGRENQLLLLEGATPTQIDRAMTGFGMAMGPHAVGDLSGLDVGYQVRHEGSYRSPDPLYYRVADMLVEAGRLGQKSGAGMYRYEPGSRLPLSDPWVDAMIAAESARLGITRRTVDDEEIVNRCLMTLINAGAQLLGDGIATFAEDIDAIWCNGYGFPRHRGGPMAYADTLGLKTVVMAIERFSRQRGLRDWTPSGLLARLASRGETFADYDVALRAARRVGPVVS